MNQTRVLAAVFHARAARGAWAPDMDWSWMADEWDAYLRHIEAVWGTQAGADYVIERAWPSQAKDPGVHAGEVELDGAGVRGIAVNIGARVAAAAGPDEVLVSSTVKDLVAGSGLRFEPPGHHTFKGVADEWELFAAVPRAKEPLV